MDETGNFSLPKSGVENGTQWRSCLNKIRHLALQEWVAFCSRKVVVPIAALVAKNLKVVPLLLASRAVLLNESAFGRHLWFSLSAKKTSKRCKSTLQKQCTTGANLRKKRPNERTFQNCTTSVFESLPRAFLFETHQNIINGLHEQICFGAKVVPKWMV